jgi:hypothetical protein
VKAVGLIAGLVAAVLGGCGLGAASGLAPTSSLPAQGSTPAPSPAATSCPPKAYTNPSPATVPGWPTQSLALGPVGGIALDSALYVLFSTPVGAWAFDASAAQVARVDRATLKVTAEASLPGATAVALAGSWLWVAIDQPPDLLGGSVNVSVEQVDATTLQTQQTVSLGDLQAAGNGAGGTVMAGDASTLWVGQGHQVICLDPATGGTVSSEDLGAGAEVGSLSLDPTGTVLYVGAANAQSGITVWEWNAVTGALIATLGSSQLGSEGPGFGLGGSMVSATASGVWISFATGMRGGIEFLSEGQLQAQPPAPSESSLDLYSNGVAVEVSGGILWIRDTDVSGDVLRCADPSSGAIRAMGSTGSPDNDYELIGGGDAQALYLVGTDGLSVVQPPPACAE